MRIGIIGASGVVGEEILNQLHGLKNKISVLYLYTSTGGKICETPFGEQTSMAYDRQHVEDHCQIVFFVVSSGFSLKEARALVEKKIVVIDGSSAFRYDADVPLILPEVNGHLLETQPFLIASPNCTTSLAAVVLFPLHRKFGLKTVIVSTYQAASGAGRCGMRELEKGMQALLRQEPFQGEIFSYALAGNVIPHIDDFQDNGYSKEEMKVVWELRKILEIPDLSVSCTCVRVPIMRCHSEALVLEFLSPVDVASVKCCLKDAPGVEVRDDLKNNIYPMPLTAGGKGDVEVGRIRRSLIFGDCGIEIFLTGDQLLKGAALNMVQILEKYIEIAKI